MLKLIEVSGAPFEMGIEWGSKVRRQFHAGAKFYKRHWKKLVKHSWRESVKILEPTIALTQKLLPLTFAELQGVGKGSGVPWQDLFVLNSFESIEHISTRERCTSIITRRQNRVLLAHNEDWIYSDRKWIYVLKAKPTNMPAFLVMPYGCWMQTYGINSSGIAFVADSDHSRIMRPAISSTFIGREIMRCRTINAAIKRITLLPRAESHTYVLTDANGDAGGVETTATSHTVIRSQHNYFVHANYFQSKLNRYMTKPRRAYSRFRVKRATTLLSKINPLSIEQLRQVLADHEHYPRSICCHISEEKHSQIDEQTIASIMMDSQARTLCVVQGNPCRGKLQKFSL